MKKETKVVILLSFIILIYFSFLSYLLFGKKRDREVIENSYKINQRLFTSSIKEFSMKEEPIYLKYERNQTIDIKDYNYSSPHINENKKLYKECLKKYKNSLKLMKKLNIKKIKAEYGNIEYI